MAITVTGNLTDSLDNRLEGVEFRITSETSTGNTVATAVATYITLADGLYSFTLVNGIHKLEVRVEDTYELVGDSIVDDSTPTPINLSDLIKYTTPIVPPVILPDDPVWQDLFDDMRTDIDSVKQEQREQIVDGNTHHLDIDTVYTNARIDGGLAEEVKETQSNNSYTSNQTLAYSDANLQEASINTTRTTIGASTVVSVDEVYSTSMGDVTTNNISNSKTSNTQVLDDTAISDKGVDDVTVIRTINHTAGKSLNKYSKIIENNTEISRVTETEEFTSDKFGHTATGRVAQTTASGYRDDDGVQLDEPISTEQSINSITTNLGKNASASRTHGALVNNSGAINTEVNDVLTVDSKVASQVLTNDGSTSVKDFNVDKLNIGTDVLQVDVPNRKVTINAQLVIGNPNDFKGEAGDTIVEVYRYSVTATIFPEDGTWHEVFVTGDLYRISNSSVNGVIDPLTWTAPAKLAAEDGANGDTIYWDYQYSINGSTLWHPVFVDGDLWRQDRLVTNGVPAPWDTAARIAGTNGDNGQIVTVEYEYSIDGLTIWHTNFSTGDHYRRERIATYLYIGDPSPTYTAWSSPSKVVPVKGVDYLDGYNQATVFLYQRGTVTPVLPTAPLTYNFSTKVLSGTLGGWAQSIPAGTNNIYIAAASAAAETVTDTIDPAEWSVGLLASSGTSGVNGQIVRAVYQTASTIPANPTGTAIPPTGWDANPPTNIPAGEFTWVAYTYADDTSTAVGSGFWSNATQLSGDTGADGIDGKILRAVYQAGLTAPTLPSGTVIPPTGWSETPPSVSGDNVVWITLTYADTATTAVGSGFWTPVGQWGGTRGSDGIDGKIIRTVYSSGTSIPTLPTGTVIPPPTWSETPPAPVVGFTIWATSTYADNDTTPTGSGYWTAVGQWSGASGEDGKVIRGIYRAAETKPTDPTGIAIPPVGWYENPPTPTINEVVWASYSYSDTDTSPTGSGTWTVAAQWSGYKGSDGADGIDATERYTWVKYADDANGTGLTDDPVGKPYIGIAYNQVNPVEGTNPLAYKWSLVKGTDGSTIYTEFQFSNNQTDWHFPEQNGDFYLRSRVVDNGVAGDWGDTTVIRGNDGSNGVDATDRYTWIKYADDADGNGLSDSPAGKKYIGIAYNKVSPSESVSPDDYTWARIQGTDGSNGDTIYVEFAFSTNALDWHFPEETGDKYIRSRRVDNGVPEAWGATTLITGADGQDGATGWQANTVFLFRDSATTLTPNDTPTGDNIYRFSTGKIETSINNSWFQDVPTNVTGKLWITTATASAKADQDTDIIPDTEWAEPKLWVESGTDGTDGTSGTGWYVIVKYAGVFPPDATATADFIIHTGRNPVLDDHLTYIDNLVTTTVSEVKRYNGTSWVAPSQIIDGDLLVNGTITGERINSSTTIIAGNPSPPWNPAVATSIEVGIGPDEVGYSVNKFGILGDRTVRNTVINKIVTVTSERLTKIVPNDVPDSLAPLYVTYEDTWVEYIWSDGLLAWVNVDIQLPSAAAGYISPIEWADEPRPTAFPIAGLNGTGDTRIWVGQSAVESYNAPFRVSKEGSLYSRGADIQGTLSASNIDGSIITGGRISGTSITGSIIIGSEIYSSISGTLAEPDDRPSGASAIYYGKKPVTDPTRVPVSVYDAINYTRISTRTIGGYFPVSYSGDPEIIADEYRHETPILPSASTVEPISRDRFRWTNPGVNAIVSSGSMAAVRTIIAGRSPFWIDFYIKLKQVGVPEANWPTWHHHTYLPANSGDRVQVPITTVNSTVTVAGMTWRVKLSGYYEFDSHSSFVNSDWVNFDISMATGAGNFGSYTNEGLNGSWITEITTGQAPGQFPQYTAVSYLQSTYTTVVNIDNLVRP